MSHFRRSNRAAFDPARLLLKENCSHANPNHRRPDRHTFALRPTLRRSDAPTLRRSDAPTLRRSDAPTLRRSDAKGVTRTALIVKAIATFSLVVVGALSSANATSLYLPTGSYDANDGTYANGNGGSIYVGQDQSGFTRNPITGNLYLATLNVVTGGNVGNSYSHNASTINVIDGFIANPTAYDISTINITGGGTGFATTYNASVIKIDNGTVGSADCFNNSLASIRGGTITNRAYAGDSSTVNIFGGNISNVQGQNNGTISILGATVATVLGNDSSRIYISGGSVTRVSAFNNSALNISGGVIGNVTVGQNGIINIYDGSISELFLLDSSVANIYGGTISPSTIYKQSDSAKFNFFGQALQFFGAVTGTDTSSQPGVYYNTLWTRPDGVQVNTRFFDRGGSIANTTPRGVTFTLSTAAPEPGVLALLLPGMVALGGVLRRRR